MSGKMGWPKLSVTLPQERQDLFPLEWGTCERCGAPGKLFGRQVGDAEPLGLEVWQECDERDRRTPVAVVLCPPCGKKVVPPHPRLYHREWEHAPIPGVMELCRACPFRAGYRCTHPDLTTNGGPGLEIQYPTPGKVHLNYGRGRGEWRTIWHGAPTSCAGLPLPDDGEPAG